MNNEQFDTSRAMVVVNSVSTDNGGQSISAQLLRAIGGGILLCLAMSSLSQIDAQSIAPRNIGQAIVKADQSIQAKSRALPRPLRSIGSSVPSDAEVEELLGVITGTQEPEDSAGKPNQPSAAASNRDEMDVVTDLEAYLERRPETSFGPSIRENLAVYYRKRTVYSKALEHLEQAEIKTRNGSKPEDRRLHDRAFAQQALLLARLGKIEEFDALRKNKLTGPLMGGAAADAWARALEVYQRLDQQPELGLRCGVLALAAMARADRKGHDHDKLLSERAKAYGLSLQDLVALGRRSGYPVQAVKWTAGATLPVPSVAHYQGNHYVALIARDGDRIQVSDPSAGRVVWVELADLNREISGAFLIPDSTSNLGFESLSESEASKVIGRGSVCLVLDDEDGPICDEDDPCCAYGPPGRGGATNPSGGPNALPGGISAPGNSAQGPNRPGGNNPGTPSDSSRPDCFDCATIQSGGMPVWRVSEPFLNTWIEDTPLFYTPGRGPEMALTLSHRQRVGDYPDSLFQETSFSFGWHASWLSVAVAQNADDVTIAHPGGRIAWYEFQPSSATMSERNAWDNSTLEKIQTGGGYRLHRPNGGITEYAHHDSFAGEYYMSKKVTPDGDEVTFHYDAGHRLDYVQDTSGNQTYFRYQHASDPNLVTKVELQMPVGGPLQTVRSVDFGYTYLNLEWRLTQITDAAGISSSIGYDANGWVDSITTPYGMTQFAFTEISTSPAFERSVVITEPEGLTSAYVLIDDDANGMPETFQVDQYPAAGDDLDGTGPGTLLFPANTLDLPSGNPLVAETVRNHRNSFYWNPLQWGAMGSGVSVTNLNWSHFKRARIRHWLWEDQDHVDTLSYEQAPSMDGSSEGLVTFYDYPNKVDTYRIADDVLPSLIALKRSDGTIAYASFQRNDLGKITFKTETYTKSDGTVGLRTVNFTYASNHIDLLTETDFSNLTVRSNVFNGNHQLLSTTVFPDGGTSYTTSFTYDGSDRLQTLSTPTGLTRTFTYGTDDYLQQISDAPVSRTESFTWALGELKTYTDARGFTRTFTFDALGRPTRIDYPDGSHEAFGYTANGMSGGAAILDLTWTRNREGNTTEFRFDGLRRMTQQIDALNQTNAFSYCDCGALESVTDALGYQTSLAHDLQGHRTGITYPNNEGNVDLGYNELGQLTSRTNALSIRRFYYNHQGLLTTVSNTVSGVELSVIYDKEDRPISVTDAHGVSVTNAFDRLGRLLTRTDPSGKVETFGYSARGMVSFQDQMLNTTQYLYDEAARRTRVTTPNLEELDYTYNAAGDLLTLGDGKNQITTWLYDSEGRMQTKKNAANQTVLSLGYDLLGQVTSRTNALLEVTAYVYDDVGNLKTVDYSDNTPDVSFGYDARNGLVSMNDGFGLTTFTNTPSGLFAGENGPLANDQVSYQYNTAGRRSQMTIAQSGSDWVQSYLYDGAERLTSLTGPSGVFGYAYPDGTGTLPKSSWLWERIDLPGGHDINQSFDSLGRLTQTELEDDGNVALNRHAYVFNDRHQRTKQTFLAGNLVDYAYDSNGQLTSAIGKESDLTPRLHEQLSYDYDDAWNLAQRDRNQLVGTLVSNSRNELSTGARSGTATASGMARGSLSSIEINDVAGEVYADKTYARAGITLDDGLNDIFTKALSTSGEELTHISPLNLPANVTYSYDANGNLLSDGSRSFEYDAENRLVKYEELSKVQHLYTYDGFGRMRQRITSLWSATLPGWQTVANVQFIYDGMNVVQERDAADNGARLVTYTRGLDLSGSLGGAGGIGGMLAYTDHSSGTDRTAFYHADGNGNITAMINTAGRVVAQYHYDPYGNLLGLAGPLAQTNRYGYSSKEIQPYSELYYYGLRFYDPSLQRWINQDPIGEAGGINLYGFVGNDPVNFVDPDGRAVWGWVARGGYWMGGAIGTSYLFEKYAQPYIDEVVEEVYLWNPYAGAVVETADDALAAAMTVKNLPKLGTKACTFVRDFQTKRTKQRGANFSSEGEARQIAREKVGKDPIDIGDNKLRSRDGRWQYRAKPIDTENSHVHLERINPETGEVIENWHLNWPNLKTK